MTVTFLFSQNFFRELLTKGHHFGASIGFVSSDESASFSSTNTLVLSSPFCIASRRDFKVNNHHFMTTLQNIHITIKRKI